MPTSLYTHLMKKDTDLPFQLPAWIALAPFEEYLGMAIESADDGRATLTMPFRAAHCQGGGLMHGGAIVALADTTLAIAIKTTLPEGTHFATIDLSLKFHAPVRWGLVTATAHIVSRSDRDITGQAEVLTEDGIKAATFHAVFRVKRSDSPASPINR